MPANTHRKSRIKKWLFPQAAAIEYAKQLSAYAQIVIDEVDKSLLLKQDDLGDWYAQMLGVLAAIPKQLEISFGKVSINLGAIALSVSRFNRKQLVDTIFDATGINWTKPDNADIQLALVDWIAENVQLIKTIPEQHLEKVEAVILKAATDGLTHAQVVERIKKIQKQPLNRAELIASDQIGKLNGQLTKMRQQAVGVRKYRWRGTLDKRQRDSHLKREGQIYDWDAPPSGGHVGTEIRCRCWAEMVLPELEQLEAALFGDGGNRHYQAEMQARNLKASGAALQDDIYKAYNFLPRRGQK